MTILKSFRVFGRFRFGEKPDQASATAAKANVIEFFHYAEKAGDDYKTFVRLSRLTEAAFPVPPEAPPPDTNNIFEATARAQILKDLASQDVVSFWTCDGKSTKPGRTLFLFDALFIDQFRDSGKDLPTERFPLVPKYDYGGHVRTSRITFGNSDQPGYETYQFRFELGFPMPVPMGSKAANPDEAGGVLSLGALFDSTRKDDDVTRPVSILTGPADGTAEIKKEYKFGHYGVASTSDDTASMINPANDSDVPRMQPLLGAMGFAGQTDPTTNHVVEFQSHRAKQDEYLYLVACRGDVKLKEASAVSSGDEAVHLDLGQQFGGVIAADDAKVTAEFHWRLAISDQLIRDYLVKTDVLETTLFRAALRFRSSATMLKGELGSLAISTPYDKDGRLILRGGGLEEALRLSAQARDGMPGVLRQPQSVLPGLHQLGTDDKLAVPLIAIARKLDCRLDQDHRGAQILRPDASTRPVSHFDITLDTLLLTGDHQPYLLPQLPAGATWRKPVKSAKQLPFRMVQPAFNEKTGIPAKPEYEHNHIKLAFDHDLLTANESGEGEGGDGEGGGIIFAIGDDASSAKPHEPGLEHFAGLETRLGSLAFSRSGPLLTGDRSRLTISRRNRPAIDRRPAAAQAPKIRLRWHFSFAIDAADPVTVDVAHGDRTSHPSDLLISETSAIAREKPEASTFILDVEETLQDDDDWQLTATLSERAAKEDGPSATFTVLSDAPFSAFRFSRQPLSQGGENRPVASYDSDTRDWRMLMLNEDYIFVRPAGSTGEAADKPGMLEIHDPRDRTMPIPPAPIPPASSKSDVTRRHVVDMRLSPPTVLWVDPSDLKRGYMLPEYRARDLFSGAGDFGLGRRLTALRTELVYGLSTGLLVPPTQDGRAGPRVAELAALTGRMLRDDGADEKTPTGNRWKRLRKAFQHRPERLEIWSLDTRRADPFVPSRFNGGLTFSLRQTALLAPPMKAGSYQAGSTKPGLAPPRYHKRGLVGGALWSFESANVARVLGENPDSADGELESVALTPMGDSGNQTVRFINGYITMITETREGRLHKHRVEILGRIAGLWHRAKHVVIYERTTAASAQFAPYPHQKTRTRRPVLRKVEEFVEILQPTRRYPDAEDVSPRSRGFLEEVRFNSHVIHVNSAWGRDVGKQGWEVPLWNRGEAELRPQVYPYPDVAFVTIAEGGGERPQAVQECLDVAHLYFYTDVEAASATPDTDRWPIRSGIDTSPFGHIEFLRPLLASADALVGNPGGDQQGPRKAASMRILPGLRRFTWRLAPSATRTRLNAERGDKPIFAGLESVSLMRAPASTPADDKVGTELGHRLNSGAPEALLRPDLVLPILPNTGATRWKGPATYSGVVKVLEAIGDGVPTQDQLNELQLLLGTLVDKTGIGEIDAFLSHNQEGLLDKVKAVADGAPTLIAKALEVAKADCDRIATKAADGIAKRKLLLLELIKHAETETIALLAGLEAPSKKAVRKIVEDEVAQATEELVSQASQGVVSIRNEIASARAIVGDWRADAAGAMVRARARIKTLRKAYEDDKPWSVARFDKAIKSVHDEFDGVASEAQAALQEARHRLAVEVGGAASALGGRVTAVIAQILRAKDAADVVVENFSDLVDLVFKQVMPVVDAVPSKADVDKAIADLQTAIGTIADAGAKATAQAVLDKFEAVANGLKLDEGKSAVRNGVVALKQTTTDFMKVVDAIAEHARLLGDDTLRLTEAAAEAAAAFAEAELQAIATALEEATATLKDEMTAAASAAYEEWRTAMQPLDLAVNRAVGWIDGQTVEIGEAANGALAAVDGWLATFDGKVSDAQQQVQKALVEAFAAQVLIPLLDTVFAEDWPADANAINAHARATVLKLSVEAGEVIKRFEALPLEGVKAAKELCEQAVAARNVIKDGLKAAAEQAEAELKAIFAPYAGGVLDPAKWKETKEGVEKLLDASNEIASNFAEAGENARAYIDRGADILSQIGDAKPSALPGLALQLFSAATQAPEIAAFRANAERIRVLLDEARDVLETTPLRGMLDQLGDALRALGLDFNFSEFGDTFKIDLDQNDFVRRLIPDFGGIKLSDILPQARLGGVENAVRLTHDIDVKAGRAWVRADVNAPLPGREELFSLGPFTFFVSNSLLKAFLRAEASKDQKETEITDHAQLTTTIEAVVGGQVMVAIRDMQISYSSKSKLDVWIDPRKIQIHNAMRFVQDTFGSIFPDTLGGLKFIKENGVPVGVEHDFTTPPMSLNFGTSGVSNIQIANHFSLRAYPDFVIANRFNLSRRELPFIFSIFIIGGTGYIQVDAEYRPAGSQLMVAVEAAVGGSAALAFSFGPVSGGVYITLSIALRYQKVIGGPPGTDQGLSVSLVLVVAGNVSLWGMVSIYLTLMLSISYQENGKASATGSLSVEVRVSRWFKLKYSTQVTYNLRDGSSTSQSQTQTEFTPPDKYKQMLDKFEALDQARKAL